MKKIKILFLCTGNSARSQMAEGWSRALKNEEIEAYSAGTDPQGLNPLAVKVMAEAGVDISSQKSKHINEVIQISFDYVITLCDSANANCPVFGGKTKIIHVGFPDPVQAKGTEAAKLKSFRQVRDQIMQYILLLPLKLEEEN